MKKIPKKVITFRITHNLDKNMNQLAEEVGINKSQLIRYAIYELMGNENHPLKDLIDSNTLLKYKLGNNTQKGGESFNFNLPKPSPYNKERNMK
jgi:antitoxin component of RelBE/YafQ-DinJ toxin-antitoxin module